MWTVHTANSRPMALSCQLSSFTLASGQLVILAEGITKTYLAEERLTSVLPTPQPSAGKPPFLALTANANQQLYEKLFRANTAPMLLIDPHCGGKIIDANQSAIAFYGYSYQEMCNLSTADINTLGNNVLPIMNEVASWEGGHKPLSFRHRMADGSERDVQTYAGPVAVNGQRLMLCMIHDISAQKATEQFNRLLLESVHTGIFGVDLQLGFTFINQSAAQLLGFQHETELLNTAVARISDPRHSPSQSTDNLPLLTICEQVAGTGQVRTNLECWLLRKDGTSFPARVFAAPIMVDGDTSGVVVSFSDLSTEKEQQWQLNDLADSFPGSVFQLQAGVFGSYRFTYASKGLHRLLDSNEADATSLDALFALTHPQDIDTLQTSIETAFANQADWQHEFRLHLDTGDTWVLGRAYPRQKNDGTLYFNGVLIDITERKHLENELEQAARRDSLTNLWNRRHFESILQGVHSISNDSGATYTLVMIDADYFKRINDNYGHDIGDQVLLGLAAIFSGRLRSTDFICRWGGEEFILLLPNTTATTATTVAESLRQAVNQLRLDTVPELQVSISIGIAELGAGESSRSLIKRADEALYKAKANGRNRVEWAD